MVLDSATQETLIAAATQAVENAQLLPNKRHLVGAACLTSDGKIIPGVNVAHYTGGPCAEPVAIGAAAALGYLPHRLTHMVAVGHRGRGVVNPCGRCRQQLLDLSPDIHVLVRDGDEVKEVSVAELLPLPYIPYDSIGDPGAEVKSGGTINALRGAPAASGHSGCSSTDIGSMLR